MKHDFIQKQRIGKSGTGFTLIELLVVIAIIGILSSIGLVSLNGAREKARDAKRRSDLAQVRTALMLFYDGNRGYPGSGMYGTDGIGAVALTALAALGSGNISPTYLSAIPRAPNTDEQYYYISDKMNELGTMYALLTKLEGGRQNWYVVNSFGYSGEIAGSSFIGLESRGLMEQTSCGFDTPGALAPCSATPRVPK